MILAISKMPPAVYQIGKHAKISVLHIGLKIEKSKRDDYLHDVPVKNQINFFKLIFFVPPQVLVEDKTLPSKKNHHLEANIMQLFLRFNLTVC